MTFKKHFWVDHHTNLTRCQAFPDGDYFKVGIDFQIYLLEDVAFIFKWKVEDA